MVDTHIRAYGDTCEGAQRACRTLFSTRRSSHVDPWSCIGRCDCDRASSPRGVRWTCALRWRWGGSTLKTGPGGSMAMPARCRLPESLDDDGGCSSPSAPTSTSDDAMPLGHQPYRRAPTSLSTSSSSSCSCWSESWSDDGMEDDATSSDGALLSHPRDHYTSTGAHCPVLYVVASSSMQPY
jgi:hypothetical protein